VADAYRAYRAKNYPETVARCQAILAHDPDNVHVWALLSSAWSASGDKEKSRLAREKLLRLDPSRTKETK